MSKSASEEALQLLHASLAEKLADAIKPQPIVDRNGEVVGREYNAAALNAAIKFLKDNGIEVARGARNKGLEKLVKSLPTTFDDENDDVRLDQ